MRRILVLLAILAAPAHAQPNAIATIYDAAELARMQPIYERGWLNNFNTVFRPKLTAEENARLAAVRLRMVPSLPDQEPLGFFAAGNEVVASTASLKFLDDIAVASAWLDINGFTNQTVSDYILMLTSWDQKPGRGRPPKPLDALCIPADALSNERVNQRANRMFDHMVVYVLLHEYGHALYRHPGNRQVPPQVSRANEEAADRFALDVLARVNEAPLALAVLFLAMAQLSEYQASLSEAAAYQALVARNTHPLSPSRLRAVAAHIAGSGRGFSGNSRVTAQYVATQINELANDMADPDLQRLSARIGATATPEDLAPRARRPEDNKKWVHLARHCRATAPTGLPLDGIFRGQARLGQTDFAVDSILTQRGNAVTGRYSFGAGFASIEGTLSGTQFNYVWRLGTNSGQSAATLRGDTLQGAWGNGSSSSGGGSFSLTRSR